MFHLRFTPYDLSGHTFSFLDSISSRYIIAQEDFEDDGTPLLHYHILIDTDYGDKSVRDAVKAGLKIPKGGRGKNNKYYAIIPNWNDPSYICKYGNILVRKGFEEAEVLEYVETGKSKYLTKTRTINIEKEEKIPKLSFQQNVIADALFDWIKYKKACRENDEEPLKVQVCDFVVAAMRKHGKGINPFMVKDLAYAVLYDDMEYRDIVLAKIKSGFLV